MGFLDLFRIPKKEPTIESTLANVFNTAASNVSKYDLLSLLKVKDVLENNSEEFIHKNLVIDPQVTENYLQGLSILLGKGLKELEDIHKKSDKKSKVKFDLPVLNQWDSYNMKYFFKSCISTYLDFPIADSGDYKNIYSELLSNLPLDDDLLAICLTENNVDFKVPVIASLYSQTKAIHTVYKASSENIIKLPDNDTIYISLSDSKLLGGTYDTALDFSTIVSGYLKRYITPSQKPSKLSKDVSNLSYILSNNQQFEYAITLLARYDLFCELPISEQKNILKNYVQIYVESKKLGYGSKELSENTLALEKQALRLSKLEEIDTLKNIYDIE